MRTHARLTLWLVAAALTACGGDNSGPPAATPAIAKTSSNSGDGQSAAPATALPNPIRVQVTAGGAAQSGTTVTWAAQNGGSTSPGTSATDANGIASTVWMLGPAAGAQTATATLAGATGSPVTFNATANGAQQPLVVAMTQNNSGDGQGEATGATLAAPLRIVVTRGGVPQAGVSVAWAAQNGGSIAPPNGTTDASGIATASWTLGPAAGTHVATATVSGATGSPVAFGATAVAGTVVRLTGGNVFSPSDVTINAGQSVTFIWLVGTHNVASDGPQTFTGSGVPESAPRVFPVTFGAAGTYNFHCEVHGSPGAGMHGTVHVQ